ncbi:hypothetical protein OAD19_00075 [Octadecabacter sp.]|nr:hypothetical protein [Octadecabacter sp.]
MIRQLFISLMLVAGVPSIAAAASFDCDRAATETEIAICNDPKLSALDELSGVLTKYVGLTINFNEIDANYDDITDHYSFGINSLLGLVAQPDIASLADDISNLSTWEAELYPRNVLIIRPQIYGLQEVLIIFGERHYPLFVEMEHINSPFSFQYSIENNVLFVSMHANPASILHKYRWQNDCWRLIGEDSTFNHRGHNPNNDPVGRSINYLTGQAILSYDNGEPIARTFDPEVWCIDQGKGSYSIDYHDGRKLD